MHMISQHYSLGFVEIYAEYTLKLFFNKVLFKKIFIMVKLSEINTFYNHRNKDLKQLEYLHFMINNL